MSINKSRLRFIRCIWHDKVDMLMWFVTIGMFIASWFYPNTGKFLWVLIFFIYYFMYRKFTFWQERAKYYRYIKSLGESPEEALEQEDL